MEAPFRDNLHALPIGTSDRDTTPSGNHTYHESRIIDANAPSEAKNYIIASMTPRKHAPVRFAKAVVPAKSCERSVDDEVGELRDDSSAPSIDSNLVEQIKSERRRRKAISARKSRQRRLEQMGELEKERNDLLKVVHKYHEYILRLQEYFGSQGILIPEPPFARPSSSESFDLSFHTNHGCLI
ncbi:hypothetical protein AX14_002049 [Amanita brunnescens Koide BX004]|nr:hypothetical protein AX14_002049 [Amanita brunnescens Koide BX004]